MFLFSHLLLFGLWISPLFKKKKKSHWGEKLFKYAIDFFLLMFSFSLDLMKIMVSLSLQSYVLQTSAFARCCSYMYWRSNITNNQFSRLLFFLFLYSICFLFVVMSFSAEVCVIIMLSIEKTKFMEIFEVNTDGTLYVKNLSQSPQWGQQRYVYFIQLLLIVFSLNKQYYLWVAYYNYHETMQYFWRHWQC